MTLHQAGFDNARSVGTALTVEQTPAVVPLHQGAGPLLRQRQRRQDRHGAGASDPEQLLIFSVKVLQLPKRLVDGEYVKQDADDFIKFQGPDAFERLLSGSENGIEFRMAQVAAKHDLTNDEGRVAYCEEISRLLSTLKTPWSGRSTPPGRPRPPRSPRRP